MQGILPRFSGIGLIRLEGLSRKIITPYPPTPFPHASGGKGAIWLIAVQEKIAGHHWQDLFLGTSWASGHQHDLAALPAHERFVCGLEIGHRKAMRNQRIKVKRACFEQAARLIP